MGVCVIHAVLAFTLGPSPAGSLASNALQGIAALIAASQAALVAKKHPGLARRFWTLIAAALAIWAMAQALYAYHENILRQTVPEPSWTHFLFRLYGAPLVMALMVVHEDEESRAVDWQRVLDFTQVGILFLFFYFDLYFGVAAEWQFLTGMRLVGVFGFSDVENWSLFAAFLVRAMFASRLEDRALAGRVLPFLLCYGAASTLSNYTYFILGKRTGDWPDVAFTLSMLAGTFVGATFVDEKGRRDTGERIGIPINWLPAVIPLLVIALALPMARQQLNVAFLTVFASVACFAARLLLTLHRRQHLMEALAASEERYANLLRLAPDAIFVHTGGRVSFANPAAARTLGIATAEELVGRHVADFAPAEQRSLIVERLAMEDPSTRPWIASRPDGTRVHLDAVGMVIEAGRPDSPPTRLVIARDVTDRRRAEAERERLIHALEAKNAELERFTYTASHDLRSPLITIGLYLSHVEEQLAKGDHGAVRDDLRRIKRAAGKMDRLLKDLLQLSRVGHVMGPTEETDMSAVVDDALSLTQGRLQARGVEVEVEPVLPTVVADRDRLVEVVQNLLDNAAKFMGPQTSPRIRIGSRREGGEAIVFVEDNGIGIDPSHRERIFGLFDKLDAQGEGTGVGLALVKRIIEKHHGRIWVESVAAPTGTRFCFTLPFALHRGEVAVKAS